MGLFDRFKGKPKDGERRPSPAAKWAEAAGSKRAQAIDRQEAIAELAKLKSPEAVEALLRRFTFSTDPSITDQEEKDTALQGILAAGASAVEPVRAFAATAESLAQPIKILTELLSETELVDELIAWLARWDTEYAKFIDPKLQILSKLEDFKSPRIREAVEPFLQDVNEPARFHAVATTLAQDDPACVPALVAALLEEESVRIKGKIADGLARKAWEIPGESREAVRRALSYQHALDASGRITKRA